MKKIALFLLFVAIAPAAGADWNPFFGNAGHQVALNIGSYAVNSGFILPPPTQSVPFSIIHAAYSLPTTFFGMPARNSANMAVTIGYGKKYGWNWTNFTIPIAFLSKDVAFFHGRDWYLGYGAGFGFQAQQNERIGSKMLFQFRAFFGYRFSDSFSGEIFTLHMSNGNTTPDNYSYGFYGFSLIHSF
jgi:hypothetical protein